MRTTLLFSVEFVFVQSTAYDLQLQAAFQKLREKLYFWLFLRVGHLSSFLKPHSVGFLSGSAALNLVYMQFSEEKIAYHYAWQVSKKKSLSQPKSKTAKR